MIDSPFHLPEAHVELFDLVSVSLFALISISQVTLDIVLVELHQASEVLVLVLSVYYLLNILLEFQNDRLLVPRLILLIGDFESDLHNFTLHLTKRRSMPLQLLALVLKIFLKLEQLVFQVVNLLFLRLQALLHLLRPMCKHVPRLLEILDLELVLVQVSLSLVQLVDFLPLA